MEKTPYGTNQRARQHAQSATTTITPGTESTTEEESAPGVTSTMTEDPIWSRPVSQMREMTYIETTTECSGGTTKKKHPKSRNETGDQGSHETTPERTARLRNNTMGPAHYTGSKMSA